MTNSKEKIEEEVEQYVRHLQALVCELEERNRQDVKERTRIIAILLDKLGGQARVFDYELLNMPEKVDVIGEISRADNSTLFTLIK